MSIIQVSDYEILNLIGKGQNPVYRVKLKYSDQEFALKKVRRQEFQHHLVDLQEVLYLIQCDHPNIMKILGFSMTINKSPLETEYVLFVLMNLMSTTLEADLKKHQFSNTPYTKAELTKIFLQISSALIYLQKKAKLAHRDIKPDNILLDSEHNCYLSDFGECFWPSRFKPKASTLVGSPYYLAPELKEIYLMDGSESKEYDPWKSDLWSFGMTLVDLASNSYAEKESLNIKFEKIEANYGKIWVDFIQKLMENEFKNRMDFVEMEKCEEYKLILKEVGLEKTNEFEKFDYEKEEIKEIPRDFKEEIDCVSQGVFELFTKIEKNGELTASLEEEFDEKIKEIEQLENINQNLKEEFKV